MNRYESFFSKLTLVSFVGGAMGSFLINFLTANDREFYTDLRRQPWRFGIRTNHEWQLLHYFQTVNGLDKEVVNKLISYYGKDNYVQPTLFAIAHIFQDLYTSNRLMANRLLEEFTFDKVLELSNKDFDNVIFPYVKNHEIKNDLILSSNHRSIPYKKRIFCYFPVDKQWLISIFSLYKHNLYKVFHNNNNYDYGTGDLQNWLGNYRENKFIRYPIVDSIPNHESINMYELVFNKNLDVLKAIYPDYQVNDLQLELLDQAYNTSMIVLNDLKLSHTMSIREYYTKSFFDKIGLTDILNASLELEKNKL